ELKEGRFRLDIRIFLQWVVRHWNRLPRDVGHHCPSLAPSLEAFKVRLDRALSNLI
ncbi:hypothetical protein N328_11661, partial [Gavia stellata]